MNEYLLQTISLLPGFFHTNQTTKLIHLPKENKEFFQQLENLLVPKNSKKCIIQYINCRINLSLKKLIKKRINPSLWSYVDFLSLNENFYELMDTIESIE